MNKKEEIICRTKGCGNPILKGKYCELCKQKRKEKRDTILAGCSIAFSGVIVKYSKPILKGAGKVAKGLIKR